MVFGNCTSAPPCVLADGDVSACIHRSFKTLAGAVPKQGLPAFWSVRATAAAKSLRWRSDFTRTPSSAAAAVVSSGRIVPSSVRMARPGKFALKTWRKRCRLVARLARLRILIGEANSELEDLEHAAFFNLYSWIDTPVDAVEESEYYRRKHVEKKELARLARARVDQLQLNLLRLQCPRTPPRRTRRPPSVTPD